MSEAAPNREVIVDILCDADVIRARKAGRDMAVGLGFGLADQTRLATAISELARNVVLYAGRGWCSIRGSSEGIWRQVTVAVEDHGPGIADIDKALIHGYSTSGGLGAGLPGSKRLMDDFHVTSRPGKTVITIVIRRRRM